ncbi:MAG: DUF927 domain-containing protein [Clostridia bacterium]|nr:DUF927 domain-containing protein [Clostridia bacterium]
MSSALERRDRRLQRKAQAQARADHRPWAAGQYVEQDGCIARIGDGGEARPLCNFTARIVAEEVRDDGAERKVHFALEGRLQTGEPLPRVTIPAERFASMGWVAAEWGNRAVVYAGQATRDHLRAAIQLLSREAKRREVYTHLGWRRIDGRWLFLHAGGALGADGPAGGVEVEPPDGLQGYALPEPLAGQGLAEALEQELALLDVAPDTVTAPLLLAVWRAPLAEARPADFSVYLAGPTQAGKSTLTALALAHYGAGFDRLALPASWAATGNALEKLAFQAKDVPLVVDDFAPHGSQSDVERLHREAERLLRAQGNRAGRTRMAADGSLRPTYFPRGLIISSGEDIPRGQSLRARLLVAELERGQVDWARISTAQVLAAEGVYAGAQAAFIRWLAGRLDALKEELPSLHRDLRDRMAREGVRDRAGDQAANLWLGWIVWRRFAEEAGLPKEQADAAEARLWSALVELGRAQGSYQRSEDPAERFLVLLGAGLASGRFALADAETGELPAEERSRRIGWKAGGEIWLEPEEAYAAIQAFAREQGQALPVTQRTLWRRLAERGAILAERDSRQTYYTVKRVVAGARKRVVLALSADSAAHISSQDMGNMGDMGEPRQDAGFRTQNAPMSAEEHGQEHGRTSTAPMSAPMLAEEHGRESWPESLAAQGPAHDAHEAHVLETYMGHKVDDPLAPILAAVRGWEPGEHLIREFGDRLRRLPWERVEALAALGRRWAADGSPGAAMAWRLALAKALDEAGLEAERR